MDLFFFLFYSLVLFNAYKIYHQENVILEKPDILHKM